MGVLYLYHMKRFEKFFNETLTLKELLETYLELRKHFQEMGFSEQDLEKVPVMTVELFKLQDQFHYLKHRLLYDANAYGFNVSDEELRDYLHPLLQNINELTPLNKDGYHTRINRWDED